MVKFVVAFLFLCLTGPALSAERVDLYSATVPVINQTESVREQALQAALRQVFIKVTGNAGVVTLPDAQQSIEHAKHYVRAYNYDDHDGDLSLSVTFDKTTVNDFLKETKQVLWQAVRPSVLAWVMLDDAQHVTWLNPEIKPPALSSLQNSFKQLGVPLLLPTFDLRDLSVTAVDDQLPLSLAHFERASKRYHADVLLLGKLSWRSGQWEGEWQVKILGEAIQRTTVGVTPSQAIEGMVRWLTGLLANRYVNIDGPTTDAPLTLTIQGLNQLGDIEKVTQYLKQLPPVSTVTTTSLSGDHVTFTLTLNATQAAFSQALQLDQHLEKISPMIYQWLGRD